MEKEKKPALVRVIHQGGPDQYIRWLCAEAGYELTPEGDAVKRIAVGQEVRRPSGAHAGYIPPVEAPSDG